MNLHAATSLAEDLGLDLVDIYGIHKWIQMQASPLNDPDIVAEMVRNLPVKEFGKHLKINRLWYNYCKAELWKQHEKVEEAYDRAVEKKEKVGDALGQLYEGGGPLGAVLIRQIVNLDNFWTGRGRNMDGTMSGTLKFWRDMSHVQHCLAALIVHWNTGGGGGTK
ncbi:hypothetical protein RhiirA1_447168, partial [Rhizophagus irregularis]